MSQVDGLTGDLPMRGEAAFPEIRKFNFVGRRQEL